MIKFIINRFLSIIPTMIGVSILIFAMTAFIPGDPAEAILGERATEESLAKLRESFGLDKPLYVQYALFAKRIVQGDLGRSFRSNQKITTELAAFFPATIELAFFSICIASFVGIIAGVISATKQYSFFDYSSMILSITGISMPIFWLGLILIIIFSVNLGWLPISGRIDATIDLEIKTGFYILDSILSKNWEALRNVLWHIILPAATMSTVSMALIARITRSSMLEVLRQDYIRTAKAKGLSLLSVHYIHALRNALVPIVTVIGLSFGISMGGAILTETIFAWPGIGNWILQAVSARDFNAIQGGVLVIAFIFVLVNTCVDLIYVLINPRIRVS
ncbi:MAG: ABC transporter permease [Desulfobacteraceae bacterium]|nr:ABC transporter permease [Desulfobacteraceae bacterium]